MKIWTQHGSEHSANLVMIARFPEASKAARVKEILDALTEQVSLDEAAGDISFGGDTDRYSDDMLKLLSSLNVHSVGPQELEQFMLDIRAEVEGSEIVIRTDETEISGFLKIMINKGARIEVYSGHDYPEDDEIEDEEA